MFAWNELLSRHESVYDLVFFNFFNFKVFKLIVKILGGLIFFPAKRMLEKKLYAICVSCWPFSRMEKYYD